jgi:hypothetical protein
MKSCNKFLDNVLLNHPVQLNWNVLFLHVLLSFANEHTLWSNVDKEILYSVKQMMTLRHWERVKMVAIRHWERVEMMTLPH